MLIKTGKGNGPVGYHKHVHLVSFLFTFLTPDKPEILAECAGQRHHKAGQGE